MEIGIETIPIQIPPEGMEKDAWSSLNPAKIDGKKVDGIEIPDVDTSDSGWVSDIKFSAYNYRRVDWTSGSVYTIAGEQFSVSSGNTGNMSVPTYIYFDKAQGSLQTTTSVSQSVGEGKILICVASPVNDSSKDAEFQAFNGGGISKLISADNIPSGMITANLIAGNTITANEIASNTITGGKIAGGTITGSKIASSTITAGNIASGTITASEIASGTITANEIASNTITSGKINVSKLDAISADMGTITAGTITGALIQTSSSSYAGIKISSSIGGLNVYGENINIYSTGNTKYGTIGSGGAYLDITSTSNRNIRIAPWGGSVFFGLNSGSGIAPTSSGQGTCGLSSQYWADVYSNNFSLSGSYINYTSGKIKMNSDTQIAGSLHATGAIECQTGRIRVGGTDFYPTMGTFSGSHYYLRS